MNEFVVYHTNTENYNKRIASYLEKIMIKKMVDNGKYDFTIDVKSNSHEMIGMIDCHPVIGLEGRLVISTAYCSEEINNKLNKLTKNGTTKR